MPFGHMAGGKSSVAHVTLFPTVVKSHSRGFRMSHLPMFVIFCVGLNSSLLLLCRNLPFLPSKTTFDTAVLPDLKRISAARHPSLPVAPGESEKASATRIVVAKVNEGFGGAP